MAVAAAVHRPTGAERRSWVSRPIGPEGPPGAVSPGELSKAINTKLSQIHAQVTELGGKKKTQRNRTEETGSFVCKKHRFGEKGKIDYEQKSRTCFEEERKGNQHNGASERKGAVKRYDADEAKAKAGAK